MANNEWKTILKGERIGKISIDTSAWWRYVNKNLSDERYLSESVYLTFEVGTGVDAQVFSMDHQFPVVNHWNLKGSSCIFCGKEAEKGTSCNYFSNSQVSIIREELKRKLEQRVELLDKLMNK